MESSFGQICHRDLDQDLQRLGRIAADIGTEDLEEEIHLCFPNDADQMLPLAPLVASNVPSELNSPIEPALEHSPRILTSKSSLVEVGWISVVTQMDSSSKIYSHWTELLPSVVNPSIQTIPCPEKSPNGTIDAELSWDLWMTTTLISIGILGDLLMTASSPVFEASKLSDTDSNYLDHPRSLSSHLKEIGFRGYVSLSQVHQQMMNELRRIPPITCHTPIQLSELVKLPALLRNLEDLINRTIEIHKAQSKVAADLSITGQSILEEEDFGRHSVLQLLGTASVVFVQLFQLWHKMEEFFEIHFHNNDISTPERNVVEPLEVILHCTNLLGDLTTANPEDVHKMWQNLIVSCKDAIVLVERF